VARTSRGRSCLGQALPGRAIAAGGQGARWQPLGNPPRPEPGDGTTTGVIVAEDLAEERCQRHQGRVDAVVGLVDLLVHDLGDNGSSATVSVKAAF